jgi:DNA-binding winged helix-turn-helix (wHTH) protein/TolB-like protein/Tfp pilus assembly protein PilF
MSIQFDDFKFDRSRRELTRGSETVHLSPKAFQLLSILIDESPAAVSKADLKERLWPDTFVSEGNLAGLITELRSALEDNARETRFIRTHYGFGYSFVAPIAEGTSGPLSVPSASPLPPMRGGRWTTTGLRGVMGAVGIAILSLMITASAPIAAPATIRTIAILPFDTSGAGRGDAELGLGLPDLLITRLSNVHHLIVRPTSAIRQYADERFDSRAAGRKLRVDAVLDGSIRTTADRVRVTVQLLNVRDQKTIFADRFDAKRSEMFALEDDISSKVADALMMRLTPNEKTLLTKRYTVNPQAYELYMEGRYELERGRREGSQGPHKKAIELFEEAVAIDPGYALAWAGIAQSYTSDSLTTLTLGISPRVAHERAEPAAQKALQLDPDLSEAHCAAAVIKMYWDFDYPGAEQELRRALELNPRNSVAMTHYAFLLQCLRRFDESMAVRQRQLEVDPFTAGVQWGLANGYLTARQDEQGIKQALFVLSMEPNFQEVYVALTRVYALRGEYDKAIAYGRKLVQINPSSTRGWAFLGYALAKSGKTAEAREMQQRLQENPRTAPFDLVVMHLGFDEREAVFPLLERALDDRMYGIRMNSEPVLNPLRSDPRFTALLRRAGFKG